MMNNPFEGVGTALATPFMKDGNVDYQRLEQLVTRQIAGNVDMLVPCGTTGEAVTLSDAEYEHVLETTVGLAKGKCLVVAGAGSNSTADSIRRSKVAEHCGVDALLIVGPYYNKPTQEGYYQHFKSIASAVNLPIIMYNVPGRTSGNIFPDTQVRISKIENVVATKEASGNLVQQMRILQQCSEDFHVLSGDDSLALPQMAIGLKGVISVVSNVIPGEFSALVHAALKGDWDTAKTLHYKYIDLMETLFIESNPIPVKTALVMMGLLEEMFRLPLVPMEENNKAKLRTVLQNLGLV